MDYTDFMALPWISTLHGAFRVSLQMTFWALDSASSWSPHPYLTPSELSQSYHFITVGSWLLLSSSGPISWTH